MLRNIIIIIVAGHQSRNVKAQDRTADIFLSRPFLASFPLHIFSILPGEKWNSYKIYIFSQCSVSCVHKEHVCVVCRNACIIFFSSFLVCVCVWPWCVGCLWEELNQENNMDLLRKAREKVTHELCALEEKRRKKAIST